MLTIINDTKINIPPMYWENNSLSSSIKAAATAVSNGSVLKKSPEIRTDVNFKDSIWK